MKAVEENLGVHTGGTTADKLFTFSEVECLGACVNAPMIQINDDYYEDLTPETTHQILNALRAAARQTSSAEASPDHAEHTSGQLDSPSAKGGVQLPPAGPLSGRESCENKAGLTNLTSPMWGPETTRPDL